MKVHKILYITNVWSTGGTESFLTKISCAMQKRGYQCTVLVFGNFCDNHFSRRLHDNGVKICVVKRVNSKKDYLHGLFRLSKKIREIKPDCIHINLDVFVTMLWTILHNKKVVYTFHTSSSRMFTKSKLWLMKTALKRNKVKITAVSHQTATEAEKVLGLNCNEIMIIENPVEIGFSSIGKKAQNDKIKFVMAARFAEVKNHSLLFRAFSHHLNQCNSSELYLAGDGELFDECKNTVKKLGIEKNVFFEGVVSDMNTFLNDKDIFVLSSKNEAMPMAILEAMGEGLPIIATNVGGVCELVDESNGIVVASEDAEAFSQAMTGLALDNEKRRYMGENSYKKAEAYSIDKITDKYCKLYEEVSNGKN